MNDFSVLKFGGSSMKTPASIKQVAKVINNTKNVKIALVSAVGGVTDKLVAFQEKQDHQLAKELLDIHLSLAISLELPESAQHHIQREISALENFNGRAILSNAELDEILSLGERLSSYLLFSFMKQNEGVSKLELLDVRDVLITDEQFGKANPLIDEINARCSNKITMDAHTVYISQGFIGKTKLGLTTTLGRGGSDYSAALLAEGIKAKHLYIYTDVPGVYSMDPNVVPEARLIARLSFSEMAEMANFGAKILHPATLAPCVRAKIPVTILSTFQPELGGTLVTIDDSLSHATDSGPLVRSITMRKNQVLVTIKSLNMLNVYGFLANIFTILAKYKISVDLITTSEVSVALTIDGTNVGSHGINPFSNLELVGELEKFSDITIEDKLTLVAVVGPSLTGPGIAQQIFAKLDSTQVRAICYGASASSIGILVQADEAIAVARLMHQKLIGDKI